MTAMNLDFSVIGYPDEETCSKIYLKSAAD